MIFKTELKKDWLMQSSENLEEHGEVLSKSNYLPKNWLKVDIPTTVVAGLVANKTFEEPYHELNLKALPGYKIDIKTQNFESHYKPKDSPFRFSWWFRKEFKVEKVNTFENSQSWLKFNGINYSANIWLNGKRISGADYVIGAYRIYDFNVTRLINLENEMNVIAVEVFSPNPDDLGISFVDWSPLPPDDDMGLWQPVYLYSTGSVSLKSPFVRNKLNIETLKEAEIIITSEVVNTQDKHITVLLEGKIEDIEFKKSLELEPYECKEIIASPEEFPQLRIHNPRIWWPYQFGSPEMYKLELKVRFNDQVSDSSVIHFGIRDIRSSINEHGSCHFSVNGKKLLLRGAAWTPDMMLCQNEEKDKYDISFIKNLNFNVIRLEGKLASDHFWDLCDSEGILVLAGWVCCSHWEKWKDWKQGDSVIAEESLRSQLLRLRNHPSLIAWFYGSDFPPPRYIEEKYLKVLHETYDELPRISSATAAPSDLAGETGVKMTGPYTFVPPIYWYSDKRPGVAKGFNTETGPDVCIPPFESLIKLLPQDQQFIGSDVWNFHAGLGTFTNTRIIEDAISNRYGETTTLKDFAMTAQVLGYECWRSMFEAHAKNYPEATGVIGWMLNSPWPSLIWQLYDYYLNPNGAYFGSKKACEPLHIQYSYDDATIWIVNTTRERKDNLTVTVSMLTVDSKEILNQSKELDIEEYSKLYVTSISKPDEISTVYFLDLTVKEENKIISKNFYWLPLKEDILAEKNEWFYTPLKTYADLSGLRNLPPAEVESSYNITENQDHFEVLITLENISSNIAFFLRVYVIDEVSDEFITPVYWSDNCISLLPSEKTSIKGIIPKIHGFSNVTVKIDGWNC